MLKTDKNKHRSDLLILSAILVLMVIGLITIYAIGPMRANVLNNTYGSDYDSNYFFLNQLRSILLSLAAFFLTFKLIKYNWAKKLSKPLLIFALFLSALLWILSLAGSSLAKCELGECRWFNLGFVSFQPAEVLKIALIVYLADFLSRKKEEGTIGKIRDFWLPFLTVCGLSLIFVVIIQGDLGTGVAIVAIMFAMLLAAGLPLKQYIIFTLITIICAVGAVVTSSHRMERVNAWLDTLTGAESSDSTYHVENAMLAIGTGGMFGVGIGNSVQATGYLPESINDSIFAILGETFGFFGLFFILMIFGTILMRTLKIASYTPEPDNRLYIIGVFAWFFAQVVVNIMAMTGLVPVTGITLPFLSYGGTSMIFLSAAMGFVLQFSCYTSREVIKNENIDSRGRLGGTHHSSRRRSA